MARKKQDLSNIFAPTGAAPEAGSDPEGQRVKSIGVGITAAEGKQLTEIAQALGVNRHQLLVFLVRKFLRDYEAGYRPPTVTTKRLKLD